MLEEALQKQDINFVVPKHKPFWCHAEVQDVVAFLKVVSDPLKADSDLLQTIFTRPWMGFEAGTSLGNCVQWLIGHAQQLLSDPAASLQEGTSNISAMSQEIVEPTKS